MWVKSYITTYILENKIFACSQFILMLHFSTIFSVHITIMWLNFMHKVISCTCFVDNFLALSHKNAAIIWYIVRPCAQMLEYYIQKMVSFLFSGTGLFLNYKKPDNGYWMWHSHNFWMHSLPRLKSSKIKIN